MSIQLESLQDQAFDNDKIKDSVKSKHKKSVDYKIMNEISKDISNNISIYSKNDIDQNQKEPYYIINSGKLIEREVEINYNLSKITFKNFTLYSNNKDNLILLSKSNDLLLSDDTIKIDLCNINKNFNLDEKTLNQISKFEKKLSLPKIYSIVNELNNFILENIDEKIAFEETKQSFYFLLILWMIILLLLFLICIFIYTILSSNLYFTYIIIIMISISSILIFNIYTIKCSKNLYDKNEFYIKLYFDYKEELKNYISKWNMMLNKFDAYLYLSIDFQYLLITIGKNVKMSID